MNLLRVIEVCVAREGRCNNCDYKRKTCEHAKQILKVEKPLEYNNNTLSKRK